MSATRTLAGRHRLLRGAIEAAGGLRNHRGADGESNVPGFPLSRE